MKTKKRILVVDDNTDYCEGVVDFLEMEGFVAVGVHDGFKALEKIKEDSFDMVLMDIRMPAMDGVETFRMIKGISPKTPVIMMTAFELETRITDALREGAYGAFQKPIDNKRLLCTIENSFQDETLVMIAGDNREFCSNLLDTLVKKGYRGVVAEDRESALQIAREERFDIIILDINQPANGLETYLTICDFQPDVEVIIITDNKEETRELVDQALEKNAHACLEKPLDIDHLLEVMQKSLKT
jgi:two-component system, NtrC family, response regulator HydG